MKSPDTKALLTFARQYMALHEQEERAREQRRSFMKRYQNTTTEGFWTATTIANQNISVSLCLSTYLMLFPDAAPTLKAGEPDASGARNHWMDYPPQYIGEYKPGAHLWVQSSSKSVKVPAIAATPLETENLKLETSPSPS